MPRPLIVQSPYPSAERLCPDAYSLRIISSAYSTSTGELNAVMQYIYQSFVLGHAGYADYADTIESIAIAEMMHFSLLGKTITALGALPVFTQCPPAAFNFYSAKYVSYSQSPKHMLEDDVRAERAAISAYRRMLTMLKNDGVSDIITRIIEDEKLHLRKFEEMLSGFKC